jgi:hypothetical protein
MSKMTKAQQKRMVRDIISKTKKLYLAMGRDSYSVSTADMAAVEKLTSKWLKRIG